MLSILSTRSIAYGGVPGLNHSLSPLCLVWLTCSNIVSAVYEFNDSISCFVGFPVNETILSNWLSVEVPGKMGFPMSISASMQPTLQISAGLPYICEPSNTSGALYQRVATSSVNITSWLNLSAMSANGWESVSFDMGGAGLDHQFFIALGLRGCYLEDMCIGEVDYLGLLWESEEGEKKENKGKFDLH